MKFCCYSFLAILVLVLGCQTQIQAAEQPILSSTQQSPHSLGKKIIEHGWDTMTTPIQAIEKNIEKMEEMPFDGIVFGIHNSNVFSLEKLDPVKYEADIKTCANIKWNKFTDNFLLMLVASDQDWFNDEHWTLILEKTKQLARAARIARCKGVCFDQEPYGTNPWNYLKAAHRKTKSFAEYEVVVRKRGAQFMRALESEMPGLTVLTFFQLSYYTSLLNPMSSEERLKRMQEEGYAFLPAFLNGMLDAASEKVEIIDGNEGAYYYTSKDEYYEMYHTIHNLGEFLIDTVNRDKYRKQVKVGQALYVDHYYSGAFGLGGFLDEKAKDDWFSHNVYWALKTTDKYVWCYNEHMNWWKNEPLRLKGVKEPKAIERLANAIRKGREVYDAGKADTDLVASFIEAREKMRRDYANRLVSKTAEIHRIPKGTAKPVLDGKLDDPAWEKAVELTPFYNLAMYSTEMLPKANTSARFTYDEENLYVSFLCQEPDMAKLVLLATKDDDRRIYEKDNVVFILMAENSSGKPVRQFIFNPDGFKWEAEYFPNGAISKDDYNPKYQVATAKNADNWIVEVAIPWKELGLTMPAPGTVYRGNFCRQRDVGGLELTSWSGSQKTFLQAEYYGYFKFVE